MAPIKGLSLLSIWGFSRMVFTSDQVAFILMAHFCSAWRTLDESWSYSLRSWIDQFAKSFPDANIVYDVIKQYLLEEKHCICKRKSTGRPTVLTEYVVNDM